MSDLLIPLLALLFFALLIVQIIVSAILIQRIRILTLRLDKDRPPRPHIAETLREVVRPAPPGSERATPPPVPDPSESSSGRAEELDSWLDSVGRGGPIEEPTAAGLATPTEGAAEAEEEAAEPEAAEPATAEAAAVRSGGSDESARVAASTATDFDSLSATRRSKAVVAAHPARKSADRVRLEFRLGRSIPIFVGSVALVLAGVWLVKLFVDRGLLPPSRRIVIGAIFSLGLMGCGEWFRSRVENIGRALMISGIVVGYATIWAAARLYGFIDPHLALVLFAALTASALLLGKRYGQWVTGAGVLGGFLVPALVGPAAYDARTLFGALALLQIGLTLDPRVRSNPWFSGAAVFGSFVWYAIWLGSTSADELRSGIAAGYLLLTTFITAPLFRMSRFRVIRSTPTGELAIAMIPGWVAAFAHFQLLEKSHEALIGIGVFAAATVLTAILRRGAFPFAAGAAIVSWIALLSIPEDRTWFSFGVAAIALLFVVVPFLLSLRRVEHSVFWSILSATTLGVSAGMAHSHLPGGPPVGGWGVWLFGAALSAAGAAVALARGSRTAGDRAEVVSFTWAAAAIAAGASFVSFERAEIGVAWSLLALLVAVIDHRAPFRGGTRVVITPLLLATAGRLLLNPALLEYPIAAHPLWNWLPWGYGIPAIAAGFVGWIVARGRRPDFAPLFWGLATVLILALIHLMVRHSFHSEATTLGGGGAPGEGEGLAYSVTWIVSAIALIGVSLWKRVRPLRYAGLAFMVLAVGKVFLWDTRSLDDLYRVISYFGLGVSLIGLSWAYHKLIPTIEERIERARVESGDGEKFTIEDGPPDSDSTLS